MTTGYPEIRVAEYDHQMSTQSIAEMDYEINAFRLGLWKRGSHWRTRFMYKERFRWELAISTINHETMHWLIRKLTDYETTAQYDLVFHPDWTYDDMSKSVWELLRMGRITVG